MERGGGCRDDITLLKESNIRHLLPLMEEGVYFMGEAIISRGGSGGDNDSLGLVKDENGTLRQFKSYGTLYTTEADYPTTYNRYALSPNSKYLVCFYNEIINSVNNIYLCLYSLNPFKLIDRFYNSTTHIDEIFIDNDTILFTTNNSSILRKMSYSKNGLSAPVYLSGFSGQVFLSGNGGGIGNQISSQHDNNYIFITTNTSGTYYISRINKSNWTISSNIFSFSGYSIPYICHLGDGTFLFSGTSSSVSLYNPTGTYIRGFSGMSTDNYYPYGVYEPSTKNIYVVSLNFTKVYSLSGTLLQTINRAIPPAAFSYAVPLIVGRKIILPEHFSIDIDNYTIDTNTVKVGMNFGIGSSISFQILLGNLFRCSIGDKQYAAGRSAFVPLSYTQFGGIDND